MVTWDGFKNRVVLGLDTLVKTWGPSKRIAVFSSGGPIGLVLQRTLDLSDTNALEISWQILNASITRIKYNSRGMMLAGFNEVTHLELEREEGLITYR